MSTIINANVSGIVQTADASSSLQFQTANTAAITIDSTQNMVFNSTGATILPAGTTAQRPTGSNGLIRYNSTTSQVEFYANGAWANVSTTILPVNSVAPVISGSSVVGQTLSSTTGTWSNSPTSYGYQWRANATNITNATSNTFTLTITQAGANITCNVTATNQAGTANAVTSNSLGPVTNQYTMTYFALGGGGGGNYGGGGGGGTASSSASVTPGTVYTLTVGGGGAGGGGSTGTASTISGTGLSVTANAGAGNGGSSSGGASGNGYAGGSGYYYDAWGYGGGGGAGGVGGNAYFGGPSNYPAGSGGSGTSTSISGSSVTYGGGGGGSCGAGNYGGAGSGGSGGGANGTNYPSSPISAAANTGGGGGAQFPNNGGAGGSGVVILSVPTSSYSGIKTGSPTVTTSGSNTILKYTSSGTYTA